MKRQFFVSVVTGFVAMLLVLTPSPGAAQGTDLSAAQIIKRVDENAAFTSAHFESTMVIRTGRRELVKEMETYSDGEGNGLVTFHNPADRGTKYLKLGDELWMYFPDADDLVKISGHMLRQGFMGSDFSYEDTLESSRMQELYDVTLVGTEPCGDETCYILDAVAKEGVQVTYAKRRMWIDADLFVARREELFAVGGRLLKVADVEKVEVIDGRPFATQITMQDLLRRGSSTTLTLESVAFGIDIPQDLFSLRSLIR